MVNKISSDYSKQVQNLQPTQTEKSDKASGTPRKRRIEKFVDEFRDSVDISKEGREALRVSSQMSEGGISEEDRNTIRDNWTSVGIKLAMENS